MSEKNFSDYREPGVAPRRVLRRIEELQALRSPLRLQIVTLIEEMTSFSVKDVALALGRSPESLHYHIRALLEVGLLVKIGERHTGRRAESLYRLDGSDVVIDFENRSREYMAALGDVFAAALRHAGESLATALTRHAEDKKLVHMSGLTQRFVKLTPSSRTKLANRLNEVIAEAVADHDPKAEESYLLTVVLSAAEDSFPD